MNDPWFRYALSIKKAVTSRVSRVHCSCRGRIAVSEMGRRCLDDLFNRTMKFREIDLSNRIQRRAACHAFIETTRTCGTLARRKIWAHVQVHGASGGRQLMPDDDRDLCEICWSPLRTLMKKIHDEARVKRNLST